jgi:hypothetical protein
MKKSARAVAFACLLGLMACEQAKVRPGDGPSSAAGGGGLGPSGGGGTGAGLSLPDGGGAADTKLPGSPPTSGPSCAEAAHDGKLAPLDLLLLLDISASMEEAAGTRSKWTAVREGLQAFLKDQRSTGFGVGLQVFPPPSQACASDADCPGVGIGTCEDKGVCAAPADVSRSEDLCNAASQFGACLFGACTPYGHCSKSGLRCAPVGQTCLGGMPGELCIARPRFCSSQPVGACIAAAYETPAVTIAELPGIEPALASAFAKIVPQGGTPLTPAATGALNHLRARAAAVPGRKPVLVIATDGQPTGCQPGNSIENAAAQLTSAQAATPGITTYLIGVYTASQLTGASAALNKLAAAGGSGAPFLLNAGEDLGQKFLEALSKIRGMAVGCEFTIPTPGAGTGAIDFQKVNVRVNGPAGPEDLRYVESATSCDPTRGGWYYDVLPTAGRPTRVLLCEATCNKVKMNSGASVELRYGCQTRD